MIIIDTSRLMQSLTNIRIFIIMYFMIPVLRLPHTERYIHIGLCDNDDDDDDAAAAGDDDDHDNIY